MFLANYEEQVYFTTAGLTVTESYSNEEKLRKELNKMKMKEEFALKEELEKNLNRQSKSDDSDSSDDLECYDEEFEYQTSLNVTIDADSFVSNIFFCLPRSCVSKSGIIFILFLV